MKSGLHDCQANGFYRYRTRKIPCEPLENISFFTRVTFGCFRQFSIIYTIVFSLIYVLDSNRNISGLYSLTVDMTFKKIIQNIIASLIIAFSVMQAQSFTIARIHYDGGGDWYSDPSSIPNLLNYFASETSVKNVGEEVHLRLTDNDLYNYPFLYLTGHGNIRFSEEEIIILREALLRGVFLHADDNYGLDESFRREMKKVFPNKDFVELPYDHSIFHSYYDFPQGLPKVHEHDGKPPQAFGLFEGERLMVLYTYESDLGDGWEDEEAHHDPAPIREAALKMGVNIIFYALTQ